MTPIGRADFQACLDAVHAIGEQVGVVLGGQCQGFDERERACLDRIRPHLDHLYRMAQAVDDARAAWGVPAAARCAGAPFLTRRERDVLRWLAGGKTDKDIGGILGISPRTVHKHLQRIYEKLGVETRTAAVVRAMGLVGGSVAVHPGGWGPEARLNRAAGSRPASTAGLPAG